MQWWGPELPFPKSNKLFFGYFHLDNILKIMNINNFRGDLTNISANLKVTGGAYRHKVSPQTIDRF